MMVSEKLENCIICGELFKSKEGTICPKCLDDQESPYKVVKDYIFFHRGASIWEVAQATGVEPKLILKYMKDGRITPVDK